MSSGLLHLRPHGFCPSQRRSCLFAPVLAGLATHAPERAQAVEMGEFRRNVGICLVGILILITTQKQLVI